MTRNFFEMIPNTRTSFLNMSTPCATIHNILESTKYCSKADMSVHTISFSFLVTPIRYTTSIQSSEMQNWTWNFVASSDRSFLHVNGMINIR